MVNEGIQEESPELPIVQPSFLTLRYNSDGLILPVVLTDGIILEDRILLVD